MIQTKRNFFSFHIIFLILPVYPYQSFIYNVSLITIISVIPFNQMFINTNPKTKGKGDGSWWDIALEESV